ncbi:hypothetical protein, partial [Methylocella sp.]|uniref:hypothetical protein n=1 Tax=Methylocella sp. TaxID=1978226 RepID=UPI003C228773
LPVNRRDHNAIWTPPNVRRKLAEAKSSSAFCYKTSVRRAASADDRAKLAGHSTNRMVRSVYDRQDGLIAAGRVAEARAKFHGGNKE